MNYIPGFMFDTEGCLHTLVGRYCVKKACVHVPNRFCNIACQAVQLKALNGGYLDETAEVTTCTSTIRAHFLVDLFNTTHKEVKMLEERAVAALLDIVLFLGDAERVKDIDRKTFGDMRKLTDAALATSIEGRLTYGADFTAFVNALLTLQPSIIASDYEKMQLTLSCPYCGKDTEIGGEVNQLEHNDGCSLLALLNIEHDLLKYLVMTRNVAGYREVDSEMSEEEATEDMPVEPFEVRLKAMMLEVMNNANGNKAVDIVEKALLSAAVDTCTTISGDEGIATKMGIGRTTVYRKAQKHGVDLTAIEEN